jgi:hypothetical protein
VDPEGTSVQKARGSPTGAPVVGGLYCNQLWEEPTRHVARDGDGGIHSRSLIHRATTVQATTVIDGLPWRVLRSSIRMIRPALFDPRRST